MVILAVIPDSLGQCIDKRPIDLNSVIVSAPITSYVVILEAPRKNIETIAFRPLLLQVAIDSLLQYEFPAMSHVPRDKYFEVLVLLRRHRVDLNILFDFDPPRFVANAEAMIRGGPSVDVLNAFIAALRFSNACSSYHTTKQERQCD